MKNLLSNATMQQVVNASSTTSSNKGFNIINQPNQCTGTIKIKQWLFATALFSCLFLVFSFDTLAVSTLSVVTEQNGKTAKITATLCPWVISYDNDFADPTVAGINIVGIQSVTRSTETINGVTCRKMIVQVKKKAPGLAFVTIKQPGNGVNPTLSEDVKFQLYDDLFAMTIPNHLNEESFLTNGFHPNEVFTMSLKVIDTETGIYHPGTNGYAMVNIIGNGFTFNGNATAQTVMFNNGMANITLHANQPNSGYCYFHIHDDSLPSSIGGSDVLHTAMISLTPPPLAISFNITNVACATTNTGSATALVTGGTSPYLYSFNNGPVSNNMNISGLTAGMYSVMVTDFYGNTMSANFGIAPPPPLNIIATVEQPFCSPNGLGSINVSVDGTSSPITYSWNDGSTVAVRNNLLPGSYSVQAVDANGCSGAKTFNLTAINPGPAMTCPSDIVANTEPGKDFALVKYYLDIVEGCTGYVDISINHASGSPFYKGVTNVTAKATDGNGLTSTCSFNVIVNDNEAPVANSKDITVTLNANGLAVLTPEMLDDSSSDNCGIISNSVSINNLSCSNIGTNAATLTVMDGNDYCWVMDSNGVKYFNNTGILINTITTAGKVTVIVTRTGGFIVSDSNSVRLYGANGILKYTKFTSVKVTIVLTPDGGYIINDIGNQTVIVCDKDGNVKSIIFTSNNATVTQLPCGGFVINDAGNHTVKVCDKDGNVISIIFTSGDVTITVMTDCSFIINDKGNHTVTVCDKDGVVKSIIFTSGNVTMSLLPCGGFIINDINNHTVTVCDKDGVVKAILFTSGDVTITVMPDCSFVINDKGNHTVTVCDKDGVVKSIIFTSGNVTITQQPCGGFIIYDKDNHTIKVCDKDGNVKSIIFTSGNVTITITPDCGFIINDINNHTVKVCDKDGVVKSLIFTSGDVTITPLPCGGFIINDAGNHTVTLCDKDGNVKSIIFTSGNVTITVTPDCGFIINDSGNHTVTVCDKNGVVKSIIFTSGNVTIAVLSGGRFIINDMSNNTVQVYDAYGNLQSTIFTTSKTVYYQNSQLSSASTSMVTVPNPLVISGTVVNVNCTGKKTGKITIAVSGLTGANTYLWSNNKTAKNLTALAAGTYTVTVTNSHGCSKSKSFIVGQPGALIVNVTKTNVKCGGSSTGKATAVPGGGTAPYTYNWNTAPAQTSAMATGLPAGVYAVIVTDANGCSKSKSVTIAQNAPLAITIAPLNGTATATVTGGVGPYTYSWGTTPVQTTATATGLVCDSSYSVTVTDSKGCKKTSIFIRICRLGGESFSNSKDVISVYPNPTAGSISVDISNEENETFNIEVLDAVGKVVYTSDEIHPGNNKVDLDLSSLANGIYSLKIISGNEIKMAKVVIEK